MERNQRITNPAEQGVIQKLFVIKMKRLLFVILVFFSCTGKTRLENLSDKLSAFLKMDVRYNEAKYSKPFTVEVQIKNTTCDMYLANLIALKTHRFLKKEKIDYVVLSINDFRNNGIILTDNETLKSIEHIEKNVNKFILSLKKEDISFVKKYLNKRYLKVEETFPLISILKQIDVIPKLVGFEVKNAKTMDRIVQLIYKINENDILKVGLNLEQKNHQIFNLELN